MASIRDRIDFMYAAINPHVFGQHNALQHAASLYTGSRGIEIGGMSAKISRYSNVRGHCVATGCLTKTSILPVCRAHALALFHVTVEKSTYGQGLFASDPALHPNAVVFKKGDYIVPYVGMRLTLDQCDDLYDTSRSICPYAISFSTVSTMKGKQIYIMPKAAHFVLDSALCMSYGAKANTNRNKNLINSRAIYTSEHNHPF
jgi:hypothetical protein